MVGMRAQDAQDFYEEDEDPARVFALFDAAEKSLTAPPEPTTSLESDLKPPWELVTAQLMSVDRATALREKAPEVYNAWIEIALEQAAAERERAATEAYVQRAQYDAPARLARSGLPWVFAGFLLVLVLCAYIASLGDAGVYTSGLVAAVSVISNGWVLMRSSARLRRDSGSLNMDKAQDSSPNLTVNAEKTSSGPRGYL
jgi:hypothetical protein